MKASLTRATRGQTKHLIDELVKIFNHPFNLSLKIEPPSKIVNFLDITLDINLSPSQTKKLGMFILKVITLLQQ